MSEITGTSILELIERERKLLPRAWDGFTPEDKSNLFHHLDSFTDVPYGEDELVKLLDLVCETTHPEVVDTIEEFMDLDKYDLSYDPESNSQSRLGEAYELMLLRTRGDIKKEWNQEHLDLEPGEKVLGLDIDGVLNTFRGSPHSGWGGMRLYDVLRNPDLAQQFDQFGLAFLRQLCKKADVKVLLITQQRSGIRKHSQAALSIFLDIPICGATRSFGARKDETLEWLSNHPQVQQYASVDDEYYYVDIHKATPRIPSELDTKSTHVRIDQHNGILYHDMEKLATFFGINLHDTFKRQEND